MEVEESAVKRSTIKQQAHANPARLIVKQIVLENFKSYAERQVIGPFHKRFTSVVGPNGSGKSNLIESLLFIFGKRARDMRLKQLQQLIHSAQDEAHMPKKASVEVSFVEIEDGEGEDYTEVAGTEFTIRRIVHHTSVSEYQIDHRKASQEEVIEKLMAKGIDLNNNRFLILQGEVEQISQMKAKSGNADSPGLLEYLEDIIGSNQHKEEIEKLEVEYEAKQEVRREKGERMRLAETELEKLNNSKETAINFVRKEKELFQLKNVQYQVSRFRSARDVERLQTRTTEAEERIRATKQNYKEQLRKHETFMKDYKRKKQQLEDSKNLQKRCQEELAKLQDRDIKLRGDMTYESERQSKQEKQLEDLEKDSSKIIDDLNDLRKELPQRQKRLEEIKAQRDEAEEEYRALNNEIKQNNQALMKRKRDIQKELDPFDRAIKQQQAQQQSLQQRLEGLNEGSENQADELRMLNDEATKINVDAQTMQQVLEQLNQALQNIALLKGEEQTQLTRLQEEKSRLEHDIQAIETELTRSTTAQHDTQHMNRVLQALLHAQSQGVLEGICGRLGDLGAIDARYDAAITTACPGLEHIVVRSYDQAQRAIEYLKQNQIGRTTFIPLDKMNEQWGQAIQQVFRAPHQETPRLFDLVRVQNNDYRVAFYSQLRNTLVTREIELATQIAYGEQRHRIVTEDGKLIEASGTMSGGGKVKRGGMGQHIARVENDNNAENQLELQKQKQKQQLLIKSLEEVKQAINAHRQRLQQVREDEQFSQRVHNERKIDMDDLKNRAAQNEQKRFTLEKLLSRKTNDTREKTTTVKELQKIEKEIQAITEQSAGLRQDMARVEAEIEQKGGDQLQGKKDLKDRLDDQFKKLEKEFNTAQAKVQTLLTKQEGNQKEKKEFKKKCDEIRGKIETMTKKLHQIEEEALEILAKLKAADEQVNALEKEQQKQSEEKKEIDRVVNEMKVQLEKLQDELSNYRAQHKRASDEFEKMATNVTANREKFKDATSQYEFLEQLDEIASFRFGEGAENSAAPRADTEAANVQANNTQSQNEMVAEEDEKNDEESQEIPFKKRAAAGRAGQHVRVGGEDLKWVLGIDVDQDLSEQKIESAEKYQELLNARVKVVEEQLNELRNDTNLNTIIEFGNRFKDYRLRHKEFEDVKNEMATIKITIDEKKTLRREQFMSGFGVISAKLKETYQKLTQGGDAELELIDSLDPFSDGVNFTVRPPKKSWKQISKLSGGEKTLSSLSLVFALHYYKPTPLYFMDEIDAALDFKNVSIVGKYIKERTVDAQFIIISLRNNMFELANKLVGVYKTFDATKTISIVPEKVLEQIQKKFGIQQKQEEQQQQQQQDAQ